VVVVVAVLTGVLLVRSLVLQSFVIPSESMQPTLEVGDRIAVNRLAYRFGEVRRGDVVVFDGSGLFSRPVESSGSAVESVGRSLAWVFGSRPGATMYVKRVVGLPGERVVCCDPRGRITVGGVPLGEPYVYPGDVPSLQRFDVQVPAGRVWVMGDHRAASADSRAHLGDPGGGTVPVDRIVGRAEAVYWPPDRAGGLAADDPALDEEDPS